jgi:hypothetical protein
LVVLVFWIAVFGVAGPLAGKLNSAQQNDASAWLPKNAESTQVLGADEPRPPPPGPTPTTAGPATTLVAPSPTTRPARSQPPRTT